MNAECGVRNAECKSKAAFLWDESFLWGVMAYKALRAARLPFDLVRAADLRSGRLDGYEMLFVPGGWASNKIKALGPEGVEAVRRFVEGGGSYLGFCGGAGLATEDGIGLVPVRRRPTAERVPSFSGRIRLSTSDHAIWSGINEPVFTAWWPSQFVADGAEPAVLARYGDALPDAFSSDVNVGDAEKNGNWAKLEQLYGINLNPARLKGEPTVMEGRFGKGRVLLSLLHFDTPDDANGARVLTNLWKHLAPGVVNQVQSAPCTRASTRNRWAQAECEVRNTGTKPVDLQVIEDSVENLIGLGEQNQLWSWRTPLLLQWRRGVRGLEYCTLAVLVREIAERLGNQAGGVPEINGRLQRIKTLLLPFAEKAGRLLLLERQAMQGAHITYERCDDPDVQALRDELFSRSKSYGGLFKELLDEIDALLYEVLTA